MNLRSHRLELTTHTGNQVVECVEAIFHTIFINRAVGKLSYKTESTFREACQRFEDVDCDFVDLSYARLESPRLAETVRTASTSFADELYSAQDEAKSTETITGEISLEFLQKRPVVGMMSLFRTNVPVVWERWSVNVGLSLASRSCGQQAILRENVSDALCERLIAVSRLTCSDDCYLPKMPKRDEVHLVFDASFGDYLYPYLFKISHGIDSPLAMRLRILRPN
ncbi:autophagy-related protein 101-like [Copidosoma floridanum]|uniref:autophagy-related protein 101-like n=1 Tax=Copidosoma floridanum TaxID=29053 RepID=UPI0006C9B37C|nr:autophagy-related protein 101-like [Copidosoma floridanum]